MKTKKIFIAFITLAAIISMTAFSFAAEGTYENEEALLENILTDEEAYYNQLPATKAVAMSVISAFTKRSSTKATAAIRYMFNGVVDTVDSSVILQVYSSGKYVDTAVQPAQQRGRNISKITHTAVFKIVSGKKYRVKIEVKATKKGATTKEIYYENLS